MGILLLKINQLVLKLKYNVMIYKDKDGEIHLVGIDGEGIRLSDGYYKTYNKEEILSYKKLNSLVVKNKMDTIYGVYVKDKNNIIYYSRNGTRLINLEKGKLSISIRSGHKYIISRNKPNSIKIEI